MKGFLNGTRGHLNIRTWESGSNFQSMDLSPVHSQVSSFNADDATLRCSLTRLSGIEYFAFLTQEAFLLPRPTGRFEVYPFKNTKESSDTPVLRATYSFPPLSWLYILEPLSWLRVWRCKWPYYWGTEKSLRSLRHLYAASTSSNSAPISRSFVDSNIFLDAYTILLLQEFIYLFIVISLRNPVHVH